ncbi:uncharacterized protein TNCV_386661 [Trichonephila clavipes]|nr:uncharacterized protein TNCV_386661 [Trichonephila clavipes]
MWLAETKPFFEEWHGDRHECSYRQLLTLKFIKTLCLSEQNKKYFKTTRNFEGYNSKMVVGGALSTFQCSQSLYNVRYTKYLGDGDSKAVNSNVENNVYGDQCSVDKLECIGRVMKRMGSRLRRLKTKMRGQKLSNKAFMWKKWIDRGRNRPSASILGSSHPQKFV